MQKKDFPAKQFFVVFVIKPEDYACGGSFFIQGKRLWGIFGYLEKLDQGEWKGSQTLTLAFYSHFHFQVGVISSTWEGGLRDTWKKIKRRKW